MPKVTLRGGPSADFGTGLVIVDGVQMSAHYWPTPIFKNNFVICGQHRKPEGMDDWKAIVWDYGGPKPSKIESVGIHITEDTKNMVLTWKLK